MSDPFIAQITMFAGNFAPRSWAFCSGQLLAISQNSALFSLVGTTYGGDGRVTFGLPDLRGRVPRGSEGNSAGPGLPAVQLGAKGGAVNQTLTAPQLPSHTHTLRCNSGTADSDTPVNGFPSVDEGATESYHTAGNANMNAGAAMNTGGGQAFDILNPYLGINFIIATQGVFPSRN